MKIFSNSVDMNIASATKLILDATTYGYNFAADSLAREISKMDVSTIRCDEKIRKEFVDIHKYIGRFRATCQRLKESGFPVDFDDACMEYARMNDLLSNANNCMESLMQTAKQNSYII